MNNIKNIVLQKNADRYRDGNIVDGYQQEEYHINRIKKGISMLERLLNNSFLSIPKNKIRILDIAGSTGTVAIELQNKGYLAYLSDLDNKALKTAQDRNSKLHCIQMDASQRFPFKDSTFHAIFAGEIIEHLFDSRLFLSECARCLKNNGVLVITTPNLATIQDRILFLIMQKNWVYWLFYKNKYSIMAVWKKKNIYSSYWGYPAFYWWFNNIRMLFEKVNIGD